MNVDFEKFFCTVRYSLVALSGFLVATGIVILTVGIVVEKQYYEYYQFLGNDFFALPSFLVATGIIIFLVAILGLFAAYTEHFYVILAFAVMMLIVFIFEMATAISGYILRKNTVTLIQRTLTTYLPQYGILSTDTTILWDEMQQEFECCGVLSPNDWLRSTVAAIPVSCCSPHYGALTEFNCNLTNAYSTGCATELGEWTGVHALSIGITGIVLCVAQALCVGASGWIARASKLDQVEY